MQLTMMNFIGGLFVVFFIVAVNCTFLYESEWQNFKNIHKSAYNSDTHEISRRKIFEENVRKIKEHNILYEKGMKSYKLGITPFADLTPEEYKRLLTLKKGKPRLGYSGNIFKAPENRTSIPKSIDWREKGAVTNVKNQGFCQSCWAFSVTGSLEGQFFLKHRELVSFSEQQLIDCATGRYGSIGCSGGQLYSGFQYVRDNGIESESSYPYEMYDDTCQANKNLTVTKIKDYIEIEPNNEDALLTVVGLIGPVSVAFDASEPEVQLYGGGIYEGKTCSQTELNHGVLIVGYGTHNGVDYWIVKNSWGTHFGEGGYMLMKRGINQCGIASEPSYPVL